LIRFTLFSSSHVRIAVIAPHAQSPAEARLGLGLVLGLERGLGFPAGKAQDDTAALAT
jgi:hypothetical protein